MPLFPENMKQNYARDVRLSRTLLRGGLVILALGLGTTYKGRDAFLHPQKASTPCPAASTKQVRCEPEDIRHNSDEMFGMLGMAATIAGCISCFGAFASPAEGRTELPPSMTSAQTVDLPHIPESDQVPNTQVPLKVAPAIS